MRTLHKVEGAQFRIEILEAPKIRQFIEAHAAALDSSFQKVEMSDIMRRRLERSNYIFSGIKTFHELNEAFPSLLDENGNRKPFEQFLNDVRTIDKSYNSNYLRAEYNFVQASAQMAAKWENFMHDGDRYNLQYRTAGDKKVRPTHAALNRITLPITDTFWEEFYPPNGWNCRCNVVQVLKDKYPVTPHDEAMALGEEATGKDTKGIFRFNPGIEQKTVPDYNPYTIRRCNDCDLAKYGANESKGKLAWALTNAARIQQEAKGKIELAFMPDNELCAACKLLHKCVADKSKSERAIERMHYLHEMEPLLKVKHVKPVEDGSIKVGFSTYGNKHLFSDTFGRSKALEKEDLASLGKVLEKATFMESSPLTHTRTDGIDRFFYYKGEIKGRKVRLNVARKADRKDNGFIRITYFLYSINDI